MAIIQTLCPDEGSVVNSITTQCPYKIRIANQFPQLISGIGRSKVNLLNQNFTKISDPNIKRVGDVVLIFKGRILKSF